MSGAAQLGKDEARAIARAALADLGEDGPWGLGCLKNREHPLPEQVFCAATPYRRIAVKVYAPASAGKARAQADRQRVVAQAGIAPKVIFFDDARLVLGMAYVDTPNLRALWPHQGASGQLDLLEAAGRWLRRLHDLEAQPHPFRPRGHVSWMERVLAWQADGTRNYPDAKDFAAEAEELTAMAPALRGLPAWRAVTHRDLHLSNLLATAEGVIGLDYENAKHDEPLRDLVTLLIDAMAEAGDHTPRSMAAALSKGYGACEIPAEAVLFLQRTFALGEWSRTPESASVAQSARYYAARAVISADAPLFG
ncbi:hypothetical protein GCM10011415_26960 [Salipiger pallidus]|uniref:Aminoglycoside phosphotransferase domain-containing protein n=1 Tax=Salipiger pallidus TaxID=1775170 RepID=A0A8J2ZKS0_9RHOB|nr:aminoglycoside phosphotransferase family protein [Salipiger pallidus]GGG76770.1 hypothetical protein GCM10011415_26960 [Salipiger pallidus]